MVTHTLSIYSAEGVGSLLEYLRRHIEGHGSRPWCKPNTLPGMIEVEFAYSNELSVAFLQEQGNSLKKFHDAAMRYGLRGYSRGEKNGIFLLRKHDSGLERAVVSSMQKSRQEVEESLSLSDISALRGVKIVCHNPLGTRVVGVYNPQNQRMLFLGTATY